MGQGHILAKDIDAEMKTEYVDLVKDGYDVFTAARMLGSTASQFKKLRNGGYWHDHDFAEAVDAALASDTHAVNQQERVRSMVWEQAEDGEKWAIEKLAYAHLPEFEKLRHSNLRVSGQITHELRNRLFPGLSDAELDERLAEAERRKEIRLLPPPREDQG